jgi:hypothetical protein
MGEFEVHRGRAMLCEMREDDYLIEFEPGETSLRFRVFRVSSWEDGPALVVEGSDRTAADRSEASAFASGAVKWDGCVDLTFDGHRRRGSLHFCSRRESESLGRLMGTLYDLAARHVAEADAGMLA